ncbi:MAG TPA: hypothetical protein DCQ83_09470 [Fibrobacteres bacterium]|nr:hypothetical protein [Fibrobacterota bacterium]
MTKRFRHSSTILLAQALCIGLAFSQTHRWSQVQSILGAVTNPADTAGPFTPLNIVLVWGEHDHATGQHEYEKFARGWQPLLAKMHNTTVSLAYYWPTEAQWQAADLVVMYLRTHNCQSNTGTTCTPLAGQTSPIVVDANKFAQMDAFLARGKGLVTMHPGNYPHQMYQDQWADRTGIAWKAGSTTATTTTYREGHLSLSFRKQTNSPILAGLPDTLQFDDEMYFPLFGHPDSVNVLATSNETFQSQTAARTALWTYSPPGKSGRVYGFIMGHLQTSFSDPVFRILLLRGMAWAANDNFNRYRRVVLDSAVYINDATQILTVPKTSRINPDGVNPFEWKGAEWKSDGRRKNALPTDK